MPIAFLDGLCADDVFVDAPFAGAPLNDLVGGAGKVAGDPRLISIFVQIAAGQTAALHVNIGTVGSRIVRARLEGRPPHPGGAVALAGEAGARPEWGEMPAAGRRGRRVRAAIAAAAAA